MKAMMLTAAAAVTTVAVAAPPQTLNAGGRMRGTPSDTPL